MTPKRKDLKPGQEYWIQPRYKKGQLLPGVIAPYIKVHLVELQSGNRALVQWDIKTHDKHIGQPNRKVITKTVLKIVSCADFQYSEADRARLGTVYDYTRRCVVLAPEPVGNASLAGQGAL